MRQCRWVPQRDLTGGNGSGVSGIEAKIGDCFAFSKSRQSRSCCQCNYWMDALVFLLESLRVLHSVSHAQETLHMNSCGTCFIWPLVILLPVSPYNRRSSICGRTDSLKLKCKSIQCRKRKRLAGVHGLTRITLAKEWRG